MRAWIIIIELLVSGSGHAMTGEDLRALCLQNDTTDCASFIRRVVSKMTMPKYAGSSVMTRQMKEVQWLQCPSLYPDEKLIRIFLGYVTPRDLEENAEIAVSESLARFVPECVKTKAL